MSIRSDPLDPIIDRGSLALSLSLSLWPSMSGNFKHDRDKLGTDRARSEFNHRFDLNWSTLRTFLYIFPGSVPTIS